MSDWLHAVGLWTDPWGERLWQASWQSALVLAGAWAIARWCTFLSPRVVCWVLRLACLKLLVTLFWIEPIGLPLLPATPETAAHETIGNLETKKQLVSEEPLRIEGLTPVGPTEPQPRTARSQIGPSLLLQALWLVGFCSCVTITIGRWTAIRRLCQAAEPLRGIGLQRSFLLEAERLGIRRLPKLRLSPRADGPLLAGIVRPAIVLPNRFEESFDESEIRLALAHELAHLKRRDLAGNWLATIVGWLFWFHPLVWLIKRRWSDAQEAACDELVIQQHVARPAEYGRLLLKLASGWPQKSGTAPVAVGMFGSYRNLERRILAMTRVRAFSLRRLVIAAAIISLVAVPGMVPWQLVAQEPDRAAKPIVNSPSSSMPTQLAANFRPERDAAAAKSLRAQTQDPKFTEAAGRGLAAFEKRDYAQALASFDEAIRLAPDYSEAHRWRGDALLNQRQLDKALAAYDDAVRLDPKNAMAYASRGMAWTEKGDPDKALADFERAIQLRPRLARIAPYQRYVAVAKSLRSKLRSRTQNPKFTEVAKRGLAAFDKGDDAQALVDFDAAIRLDPNHSEARRWRGDALLNQDEYDKALVAYEEAIRLDPKNAMAYVSRGMAWTAKKDPGPALLAFETAVSLDPQWASRPLFKRYVALAQSLLIAAPVVGFDHPDKEKSPFAAIRWQESQPEVKVGDEWFKLVSLDGIPATEIVAFSRQNFADRWQMRFEEDLVELLTRMGHPPRDTATLVVQTLKASETRTPKEIPMTAANRWAIKTAGDARRNATP
jgi:beta-lactamase regulating signal transducer with metallopeptidase domain/Tfp pilus assembly protein PilF